MNLNIVQREGEEEGQKRGLEEGLGEKVVVLGARRVARRPVR
jgi:hypothetical protein